jgi:hypothetical protein
MPLLLISPSIKLSPGCMLCGELRLSVNRGPDAGKLAVNVLPQIVDDVASSSVIIRLCKLMLRF